jgi:hypothetical protein
MVVDRDASARQNDCFERNDWKGNATRSTPLHAAGVTRNAVIL